MPRLSDNGHWAMGAGGHQGSVDQNFIANAMGPYWIDTQNVAYPTYSNTIEVVNPFTGAPPTVVAPRGCNDLRAGGGIWAAWLDHYGLWASTGWHNPIAGLLAVGPLGEIGYTPNRQEGLGCNVRRLDGSEYRLGEGVFYDLQLLHAETAIWTFGQNVYTKGIPVPQVLPGGVWGPKIAYIGMDAYICYFSGSAGVVMHRTNDASVGWIFAGPGVNAYNHDMKAITSNVLRIIASKRAGEEPVDLMLTDYIPGVTPMVPLIHEDPIVVIGKPCDLAWFEFNQFPPALPPGNAMITVRWTNQDSTIIRMSGTQFATWVGGSTVAEINAKVANSPYPVLAYWDGRYWPEWPTLRADDWLCLFGYCYNNEIPSVFEQTMRGIINGVPSHYTKIAINCQCYTSNASLTTDLKGLVPVYARLARDYPRINFLSVFSDQDRKTGLNDHPELRPDWQKLYEGITGEPSMDNGIVDGVLVDPQKWWLNDFTVGENPANYEEVMKRKAGEIYKWGLGQQNNSSGVARGRLFLPWSSCPNAAPRNEQEYFLGVNQDASCCGIGDVPCKKVDVVDQMATQWIWLDRDPGIEYQPIHNVPPPPGDVSLQIFKYTNPAKRSDPLGMVVEFEAASQHPIVEITYDLNDGDLPFTWKHTPGTKDGRYFRVQGIKVTVNGNWFLTMTATNNQGHKATVQVPVTVTF